MLEHFFQCPYCGEKISMLFDVSILNQKYIEDCEVCCNPIELSLTIENNEVISIQINNIGQ